MTAKPVKVYGDATILFPLLVSQTFARHMTIASRRQPHNDQTVNGDACVV